MDTIQIKETELRRMLTDEETPEATLERYFEVDDSKPFSTGFRLRPEVEVIKEEEAVEYGIVGSSIVRLANRFTRLKRHSLYRRIIEDNPDRLRLVSEGDSWFQHPLVEDTIDHMFNHYAIFSLGAVGDELSNMFRENEFVDALENQGAKALLLSGGGNDLMGGHFGDYLNPYSPGSDPRRFLNDRFFVKVQQMMNIYRAIFTGMRQRMSQIKILTHGYDYVRPGSGKHGKWLGKPMEDKNIVDPRDKAGLIRAVINEFNGKMADLAAEFGNVEFVDVRNTVAENQWYDEIHPDSPGFQQVALKFIERISSVVV